MSQACLFVFTTSLVYVFVCIRVCVHVCQVLSDHKTSRNDIQILKSKNFTMPSEPPGNEAGHLGKDCFTGLTHTQTHTCILMLTVRQESIINMEQPGESVSDVVWVGGVLMWMDASHILRAATSQLKWWLCAFTLSGGLPVINLVTVWWMRVSLTSFWGGEALEASAAGCDDSVFEFSQEQIWNWQTGWKLHFIWLVWA